MPEFESYVDVDPSDFVDACSKREIKELIDILTEDGHIKPTYYNVPEERKNIMELEWGIALDKLSNGRLMLTREEEETILKIAKRF